MRVKHPPYGFTMIELLVTIACIAILAVAAIPATRNYMRTVNLRQAVYKISGDLYAAKSQAIKSGVNCSITFDPVAATYTLSNPVQTTDLKIYSGKMAFTANPDAGGQPGDAFSPVITFNARGFSGLDPPVTTQVYVTNQDKRVFRVQVTATGAISVRLWNPNGNTWLR
jgi:prepilin-type N-terminal cleavage/methylation domain-containing protein